MLPGISTACFYPELTECALSKLAESGVAATEVFLNAPSEMKEPYIKELGKIAASGGTRVLSVHPFSSGFEPFLLFSTYRRRTEDGLEYYKGFFGAAALLGAKYVVIHGDGRRRETPRPFYFDVFGELIALSKRMGVLAVQENVPRCNSFCPDFFVDMAAYLPEVRFVLDIKQSLRAGYRAEEMAAAMGRRVCHVHMSDNDETRDCLPVGQGTQDTTALLGMLHRQCGFDGGVVQEIYRDNFADYPELYAGYQALARCVALAERL